jgi:hypothetical protein
LVYPFRHEAGVLFVSGIGVSARNAYGQRKEEMSPVERKAGCLSVSGTSGVQKTPRNHGLPGTGIQNRVFRANPVFPKERARPGGRREVSQIWRLFWEYAFGKETCLHPLSLICRQAPALSRTDPSKQRGSFPRGPWLAGLRGVCA